MPRRSAIPVAAAFFIASGSMRGNMQLACGGDEIFCAVGLVRTYSDAMCVAFRLNVRNTVSVSLRTARSG
jgi:hypothetical protein